MPKSSSLASPASVTNMFEGLMSRWTTRLACASPTASSTCLTSPMRDASLSARCVQYRSIGSPATYSMTRYGWPVNVTPASSRRAMFGWERRAKKLPSCLKRSSPVPSSLDTCSNLTAANPSNRPSSREASHTLPMPPWPRGRSSFHAPIISPARDGIASVVVVRGGERNPVAPRRSSSSRRVRSVAARSGLETRSSVRNVSRDGASNSSARSSKSLTSRQDCT